MIYPGRKHFLVKQKKKMEPWLEPKTFTAPSGWLGNPDRWTNVYANSARCVAARPRWGFFRTGRMVRPLINMMHPSVSLRDTNLQRFQNSA